MKNMNTMSAQQKLSLWEDQREIQNLMGRYTCELLQKHDQDLYELFWTKTAEPCLGLNHGYYKGISAVQGYYEARHQATLLKSRLLAARFPEKLGQYDEAALCGVGQIEYKPLTSPYVVIANDGRTAKGMWFAQGNEGDLLPSGPENFWTLGCFAADFIREDGQWRILNLLYLEDVHTSMGSKWDAPRQDAVLPEFAELADFQMPAPTHPVCLRTFYSSSRPHTELPRIPEAYETLAETFSYGI